MGWQKWGQSFLDSSGVWKTTEYTPHIGVSMSAGPGLAGTQDSEQAACEAVLSCLNGRGGNWGPAEKPTGLETGIDRIVFARTVVDRRCARRDEICKMQVTRVIKAPAIWKALATVGTANGYSVDSIVDAMQEALAAKRNNPAGKRDDIILILDAMEVLVGSIDPIIRTCRARLAKSARALGFQDIWVAAPFNGSFRLLG